MKRVAVLSSPEYARCREKISEGLDLVEFNETLQGKKVLLKVNLLSARLPDSCVTTNPAFVRAVAEVFLRKGAIVSIGDSPASVRVSTQSLPTHPGSPLSAKTWAFHLSISMIPFL